MNKIEENKKVISWELTGDFDEQTLKKAYYDIVRLKLKLSGKKKVTRKNLTTMAPVTGAETEITVEIVDLEKRGECDYIVEAEIIKGGVKLQDGNALINGGVFEVGGFVRFYCSTVLKWGNVYTVELSDDRMVHFAKSVSHPVPDDDGDMFRTPGAPVDTVTSVSNEIIDETIYYSDEGYDDGDEPDVEPE